MFMKMAAAVLIVLSLTGTSLGQSGAASGERIVVQTASLPKGFLRQQYRFRLEADGRHHAAHVGSDQRRSASRHNIE